MSTSRVTKAEHEALKADFDRLIKHVKDRDRQIRTLQDNLLQARTDNDGLRTIVRQRARFLLATFKRGAELIDAYAIPVNESCTFQITDPHGGLIEADVRKIG